MPETLAAFHTPTQAWSRRQKCLSHNFRVSLYIVFLILDCVFSHNTRGLEIRKIFQSTKYQFWRLCVRKNSTSTSPRDPFSFSEGQPMVYWVIKAILMATQHLCKWFHGGARSKQRIMTTPEIPKYADPGGNPFRCAQIDRHKWEKRKKVGITTEKIKSFARHMSNSITLIDLPDKDTSIFFLACLDFSTNAPINS